MNPATMRRWWEEAACVARLRRDLPGFLSSPLSREGCAQSIREAMARREDRFLDLARRAVYGHPRSPYRALLRAAGCEQGDLERLVRAEGVEGALRRLAAEGVRVSLDEFKGRREAVRGARRFAFRDRDFDNPRMPPHFVVHTGGTRNAPVAIRTPLAFVGDMAASTSAALAANGLEEHGHAYWLFSTAVTLGLRMAKLGAPPLAWFFPLPRLPRRSSRAWRFLCYGGLRDHPALPTPRFLDLMDPGAMAGWLHEATRGGRKVCLTCYASSGARVAAAARERGLPLDGVCFILIGEPVTDAKRAVIESAGAGMACHYGFMEGGLVGFSCPSGRAPDDVHLFRHAYAAIQEPRRIGVDGTEVRALLFTSLSPSAPKILFNLEIGDHARLESRDCGCGLGALGLREHLSHIRSHEKLTGEGMTFVAGNLIPVLEQVLPARFGGSPSDYQLVEEEDPGGILRLLLRVSPGVGPLDPGEVGRVFLDALRDGAGHSPLGTEAWRRAGTVQVVRGEPEVTDAGKILPFHLKRSVAPAPAPDPEKEP